MNKSNTISVTTFNFAGWGWKSPFSLSYRERLERLYKTLIQDSAPEVLCLQEYVPGKDCKNIELLREALPGYFIILPVRFDPKNHKSAINITLIKASYCNENTEKIFCMRSGIRSTEIEELSEIRYLYNYMLVTTSDCGSFRLLNVHMPNNNFGDRDDWYTDKRKQLRQDYCRVLEEIAAEDSDIPLIIAGDFNCDLNKNSDVKLTGLTSLVETDKSKPTFVGYKDKEGKTSAVIDHIVVKNGSGERADIRNFPIIMGISDHAVVSSHITLS